MYSRSTSLLVGLFLGAALFAAVGCGEPASNAGAGVGAGPDAGVGGAGGIAGNAGTGGGAVDDGLHPVLSDFRVAGAHPNRVYFDSSEPITASTTTGFVVSGRTLTAVHVQPGSRADHYFTVAAPFTFWDNNTIRYEEGSDLADLEGNALYGFTLQYVANDIPEPPSATERYVTVSGAGNHDGTPGNEWTLTEAFAEATAGMTVWIRAANYGNVTVTTANGGTVDNPIKFVGYKSSPGDVDSMYWTYSKGNPLVASELPLLDGGGQGHHGIRVDVDYVIIRNIQTANYSRHISRSGPAVTTGLIVDNCLTHTTHDTIYDGVGVYFESPNSTKNRVVNTTAVNADMDNLAVASSYSLVDNCRSYGDADAVGNSVDYYIYLNNSNNIVRNSLAYRAEDVGHQGHGITVKGNGIPTEYNLIENVEVRNCGLAIECKHDESRYNVMRNVRSIKYDAWLADNYVGGIVSVNGASHNVFERIYVENGNYAIRFGAGVEDPTAISSGNDNILKNSVFNNVRSLIRFDGDATGNNRYAHGNEILNCIFRSPGASNSRLILNYDDGQVDNHVTNCIITNASEETYGENPVGVDYTYCDFYDNGFAAPPGEGNISVDPDFVDTADLVPQNAALNVGATLSRVRYDINGRERIGAYTIGAFEIDEQ